MEQKFWIRVYLDAPIYDWKMRITQELTHDELLKLWRDFKKWILVHVWQYLINKRHITAIECVDRDVKSVDRYLESIMYLEENPTLNNNLA